VVQYTKLGRTGLRVSRLCLGAACYGYVSGRLFGNLGMSEEMSFRLMDLALGHGGGPRLAPEPSGRYRSCCRVA
jgi:aryl-alcohol dehydrogenase-like predicted oxidoreductase